MDVTVSRARPREVPVAKPSAAQSYIPKVLLRDDDNGPPTAADGKRKTRWMPSEKRPGASKHLTAGHANLSLHTKIDAPETVSDLDAERLQTVEDELTHLETELDHFVHEFYVATASFSAHADAQKQLLKTLTKPNGRP